MAKYFNEQNVARMLDCMSWIKTNIGVDTYPVGGTLLGITREKDFIEDDYDIDIAYLSLEHEQDAVLAEFNRIVRAMQDHKLLLKRCAPGQIHIGPWGSTIFDLWTSWIDTDGRYHQIFMIDGELTKDEVFPLEMVDFLGHQVPIQSGYRRLNSLLYGTWEVRDPKFSHDKRRMRYLGPR